MKKKNIQRSHLTGITSDVVFLFSFFSFFLFSASLFIFPFFFQMSQFSFPSPFCHWHSRRPNLIHLIWKKTKRSKRQLFTSIQCDLNRFFSLFISHRLVHQRFSIRHLKIFFTNWFSMELYPFVLLERVIRRMIKPIIHRLLSMMNNLFV